LVRIIHAGMVELGIHAGFKTQCRKD